MRSSMYTAALVVSLTVPVYSQGPGYDGFGPVKNNSEILQLEKEGKLRRLRETDSYIISQRIEGRAYARPYTKELLGILAGAYSSACGEPMVITGALVTEEDLPKDAQQKANKQTSGATVNVLKDCARGMKRINEIAAGLKDCSEVKDYGDEIQITAYPNISFRPKLSCVRD